MFFLFRVWRLRALSFWFLGCRGLRTQAPADEEVVEDSKGPRVGL